MPENSIIKLPNHAEHALPASVVSAVTSLLPRSGEIKLSDWPLGTKFHRSKITTNSTKYTIRVSVPNDQRNFDEYNLEIDSPLERSIVIGPAPAQIAKDEWKIGDDTSSEPWVYALEHNEDKKYLRSTSLSKPQNWITKAWNSLTKKNLKPQKRNSSVKFAFSLGSVSSFLSSSPNVELENIQTVVYKHYKNNSDDPQRQFSSYRGVNLFEYFLTHHIAGNEAVEIALLLCKCIKQEHDEGYLLNDIKPTNFVISQDSSGKRTIHYIDKKARILSASQYDTKSILYTKGFVITTKDSKGEVISVESPSQERDLYALGKTLQQLAYCQGNQQYLIGLGGLLSVEEKETRLNVEDAFSLLNLAKDIPSSTLIDSLEVYFRRQKKKPKERIQILTQISAFLKQKQADPFQLEAIAALFYPTNFISQTSLIDLNTHLEKIFYPEKGTLLVCAILGAKEYLTSTKKSGKEAQALMSDFVTKVMAINQEEDTYSEQIVAAMNKAIAGKSFIALKEAPESSKKQYSRRKILGTIQATIPAGGGALSQDDIALAKLKIHFPKISEAESKAYKDVFLSSCPEDKLKQAIIQTAINYILSKEAGWIGKMAVSNLVKNLLSHRKDSSVSSNFQSSQSENGGHSANVLPQSETKTPSVQQAIKVCCSGFMGVLFPSSNKIGSRRHLFENVLNSHQNTMK